MDDLALAAEFPAATHDQWLMLARRVLKDADVQKALVARTYDGITIEPIYGKAQGAKPAPVARHGRWRIAQRVEHPDPTVANELVLADLEGGADTLILVFPDAASARGFGLQAEGVDELDRALRNVQLDLIQLRIEAGSAGFAAAALVAGLAERRGHALPDLNLDLGIDPIGAMAASGSLAAPWPTLAECCAETLSPLLKHGFRGRAFLSDGRPYHEAGAGEAQELAAVLATGLAYLRALEAGGHEIEAARDALSFLLVADADKFLTIAKLRALRRLWARVEEACGLGPKPTRLHAETAWRMATRRDPWTNMLRATVAAFAAGIGGADSVAVLPFTAALGLPDAFARRIARNTQLILLEEANLWRVADPAAGAGGFEALTDALCERAWDLFQDIEREGGIVASLQAGAIQGRIAAVRRERERSLATGRQPITGTSAFPNLTETLVGVLLPSALASKVRNTPGAANAALPSTRDAEPYERLRDASDAQLARTGARPSVFLANLGAPGDFMARAAFAKTFFESGGIEAVMSEGLASPETAAAAFAASGATLACLCASDRIYESLAPAFAESMHQAGARKIYLAGQPDRFRDDVFGARTFACLFAGCDALALLSEAIEAAT